MKLKFQKREIEKKYHAFVYGNIKDDSGTIDRPIARSRKDFRIWSAQRGGRGVLREAVTDYRVMGRNTEATFVEVLPKTGRTHQIRVHFKAINHPVVCDRLYAPKREPMLGFERLALHAYTLCFTHGEKQISIQAPYPADFENAVREFGAAGLP